MRDEDHGGDDGDDDVRAGALARLRSLGVGVCEPPSTPGMKKLVQQLRRVSSVEQRRDVLARALVTACEGADVEEQYFVAVGCRAVLRAARRE